MNKDDTGIVYDAAAISRILGLPCECSDPPPKASDGEVVVYYGGWDLKTLRLSPGGKKRMWQGQVWYDKYGWTAEPGYYRLLLPVPESNGKIWNNQISHLIDTAWKPAPICVATTALLVHLTETGNDLLMNDGCRCAEALPDDHRAGLWLLAGYVRVISDSDDRHYDRLWLSAALKS